MASRSSKVTTSHYRLTCQRSLSTHDETLQPLKSAGIATIAAAASTEVGRHKAAVTGFCPVNELTSDAPSVRSIVQRMSRRRIEMAACAQNLNEPQHHDVFASCSYQ
jgi:hypothetical protein